MAVATLTVTFIFPSTSAALNTDAQARQIAVEVLQQVAFGVGAPGATSGATTHMVSFGDTIAVADWTWTPAS